MQGRQVVKFDRALVLPRLPSCSMPQPKQLCSTVFTHHPPRCRLQLESHHSTAQHDRIHRLLSSPSLCLPGYCCHHETVQACSFSHCTEHDTTEPLTAARALQRGSGSLCWLHCLCSQQRPATAAGPFAGQNNAKAASPAAEAGCLPCVPQLCTLCFAQRLLQGAPAACHVMPSGPPESLSWLHCCASLAVLALARQHLQLQPALEHTLAAVQPAAAPDQAAAVAAALGSQAGH